MDKCGITDMTLLARNCRLSIYFNHHNEDLLICYAPIWILELKTALLDLCIERNSNFNC